MESDDRTSPRLLTFSSGGWVLLLAFVLTGVAAGIVLLPVWQTGFRSAVGDGQHLDTYGFDLSACTIAREQLIPSGKAKDGVRDVPESLVETMTVAEVDLMNKHEYSPFLLGPDRLIGVVVNGEARAYPIRLMNLHEIVNDRIGATAFAVTWAPLCGSAVVFARPTEGAKPLEFGVSGLLYNSNLLMFDRHDADAKAESLWPQLGFHGISGPAVGKTLEILPFELTTWKQWSTAHSDTRVFRGLRTLKQSYTDAQDPYNMYWSNDEIRFPVTPLWQDRSLALKTPLVITTEDGKNWVATKEGEASSATTRPNERRVYAFLFAWYAQHSSDTEYRGIAKGR